MKDMNKYSLTLTSLYGISCEIVNSCMICCTTLSYYHGKFYFSICNISWVIAVFVKAIFSGSYLELG